ncbi:signal peptidase II [Pelagibaculum spongiae]|uniref:Lipoprotein signal peptidase n=1 Tax=Pelagibaculum spongiae TaxID=2080658 RepID=A0A2V1GZR9_9GAMM|nr:signal peptidase II [Pelagibaculum spongiae]PVZ70434.1 signal peptidase II [Pelagibaculum spongiae]
MVGRKSFWVWMLIAAFWIIFDQTSKYYAELLLEFARPIEVFPFFNWTLLYNEGAAFSFLSDAGGWQRWFFSILAGTVSVVIAVWLWKLPQHEKLNGFALSCVLGGAVGNLIDRVRLGHVVDFLDFYYQNSHWPAFNVADVAIVCGVILMLLDGFINKESK